MRWKAWSHVPGCSAGVPGSCPMISKQGLKKPQQEEQRIDRPRSQTRLPGYLCGEAGQKRPPTWIVYGSCEGRKRDGMSVYCKAKRGSDNGGVIRGVDHGGLRGDAAQLRGYNAAVELRPAQRSTMDQARAGDGAMKAWRRARRASIAKCATEATYLSPASDMMATGCHQEAVSRR